MKKMKLRDYVSDTGEYIIPVSWEVYSTIKVKADNLEDAVRIAEEQIDEIPLCSETEYIDDSYKIEIETDDEAIAAQDYVPIGSVVISKKLKVCDIEWDTEDKESLPDSVSIPIMDLPIDKSDRENIKDCIGRYDPEIADYLSDTYGFCVRSFTYEI